MLEGRHKDTAEPKHTHKSGWCFRSFHFRTSSPEYEAIEIRAIDNEHALKQAEAWGRKCGFQIVEQM